MNRPHSAAGQPLPASGDAGRTLWYIVTPVYKPAPGGGAIYTDILARALVGRGADVCIETEAYPGKPRRERLDGEAGTITLDRLYPLRAGRAKRDWRSYLAYALQNLKMLGMPGRVARAARSGPYRRVILLVHCSLLYKRTVLPAVIGRLHKAHADVRLLVDVRDPNFGPEIAAEFARFDTAIGCSQGVAEKLRSVVPGDLPVEHIPMPFEFPPVPADEEVEEVIARHGLTRGRYLFNPNGITEAKHYPAMREAVGLLRQEEGFSDVVLVTAGRERDRSPADDWAEAQGHTRYVGVKSHAEVLAFMKGAMMTLVLSRNESISRAALEAMAVGGKVLLPDLPEYRADCASHVCAETSPQGLARQIAQVAGQPQPAFDFTAHLREAFLARYAGVAAK